MRLLRAHFRNFRLLRDIELSFSTDPTRNLTVIRAANDSGKTTVLLGLQWALYGDDALPKKGKSFRLHPIDWQEPDGSQAIVTATVDFEHTSFRHSRGRSFETTRRYRLIRTAIEDISHWHEREPSTVALFLLDRSRTIPVDSPESTMNDHLPQELREVFFTDGDRALSFIESDAALSAKRKRVQGAIRSLLGLGVLDKLLPRVRQYGLDANKRAKATGTNADLHRVLDRLQQSEDAWDSVTTELDDAKQQFAAFDSKLQEIERDIEAALRAGDRDKLAGQVSRVKDRIRKLDDQLEGANVDHSRLFCGSSLAFSLVKPLSAVALGKLAELRKPGPDPQHDCARASRVYFSRYLYLWGISVTRRERRTAAAWTYPGHHRRGQASRRLERAHYGLIFSH